MASTAESEHEDLWNAVHRAVRQQVELGIGSVAQDASQARTASGSSEAWQIVGHPGAEQDSSTWQDQQWQNAFVILFLERPASLENGSHQDDLLFFVLKEQPEVTESPFLVRRKGKALPPELGNGGAQSEAVDWQQSVLLNLVLQTDFQLWAAIVPRAELLSVGDEAGIAGRVYASPSRVEAAVTHAGEETMVPAYPDICFAVDGTHAGFADLVLRKPDEHLIVKLTALGSGGVSGPDSTAAPLEGHAELLAGSVSYEALAAMLPRPRFGREPGTDLSLRGVGGAGAVKVYVRWQRQEDSGHLLKDEPPQADLVAPQPSPPPRASLFGRAFGVLANRGRREAGGSCPAVHCAMLEAHLPVSLLAPLVLGLPRPVLQDS